MIANRSHLLCCAPCDPYCTRQVGHESECRYDSEWYRGRHIEACERCGGPFGGVTVSGGELLLCTTCAGEDAYAAWEAAGAAADKKARATYARQRLNERRNET